MHFWSFVCSKNIRNAHDERQYNDTKKGQLLTELAFYNKASTTAVRALRSGSLKRDFFLLIDLSPVVWYN